MSSRLSEKLKSLRKEKGASQEKLAKYLGVSFQAVSKWENDNTYPDISLLPDIARFFGVTVDELLCVEKLDEEKLFEEYSSRAYELYLNGKSDEITDLWRKALRKMPNSIKVKEMLMASYFDADKVKYKDEIVELGAEIYNSDAESYYKGQALSLLARTYAENGNTESAEKWGCKSYRLMHSSDVIATQIYSGEKLLQSIRFYVYWALQHLPYMAFRMDGDDTVPLTRKQIQNAYKTIASIYDAVYINDDMGFETMRLLFFISENIAEIEAELDGDENVVRANLERALELAEKSMNIDAHKLDIPLLYGWEVDRTPADSEQCLEMLKKELGRECFAKFKEFEWFAAIERRLSKTFDEKS